ncbi:hypothetical protein INF26_01490 [Olsenella sp. DSM 107455]|uniref:Anti-sigma factor RsgI-like middle domain-containing protein n=1 Tax=Thermophilibacter gallinarum TaxID=2779357 RepID=A0ABR9QR27_9ACTN|nr:hypothetical protein [Thermophilibacter gallinarum]MBE5023527.1 hypothetical protein [Thermophilibacter gallinarum]
MSYLVMECHPAYAVVLDERGRFVRVPNLGYEVGQRLDDVVTFDAAVLSFEQTRPRRARRGLAAALAAAACLCALVIGGFAVWQTPIGTVHMSINPEVDIDVNHFDRVVGLEGDNEDGEKLVEGFSYYGRTIDEVSDDLAVRAKEQGYLVPGGTIQITVESDDEEWRIATEDRLIIELEVHLEQPVVPESDTGEDNAATPAVEVPSEQPVPVESDPAPEQVVSDDDDDDWDDWDDDDWDDDDDDWDDEDDDDD